MYFSLDLYHLLIFLWMAFFQYYGIFPEKGIQFIFIQ